MSNEYLSPSQGFYYDGSEKKKKNASTPGWTPLVSKTYFNEQLLSFNSTPNKNAQGQELIDYSLGLNLTPFLTQNNHHSWNGTAPPSAAFNSIQHQLSNITPFHDKTLHLTDFFMDSPIRNTPDMATITPSKFRIGSEKKLKSLGLFPTSTKRSITAIDTPPRQPHKLSITTKVEQYQTPSKKVLKDITNVTPSVKKFQTPAKQIPDSSPLTVIMSSAIKSSPQEVKEDDETDDESDTEKVPPASPTPNKQTDKPIMGVFQERKKKKRTFRPGPIGGRNQMQAGMNKFQIVFTDVHALVNKKGVKSKKVDPVPTNSSDRSMNSSISSHADRSTSSHTDRSIGNTSQNDRSNISHNLSTDHSLFDISLTPNSKYFLGEKPSPQAMMNNGYFLQLYMPPPKKIVMGTPQTYAYDGEEHEIYPGNFMYNGGMMPPRK